MEAYLANALIQEKLMKDDAYEFTGYQFEQFHDIFSKYVK